MKHDINGRMTQVTVRASFTAQWCSTIFISKYMIVVTKFICWKSCFHILLFSKKLLEILKEIRIIQMVITRYRLPVPSCLKINVTWQFELFFPGSPWRVNVVENNEAGQMGVTPEPRQSDANGDYLMIKGDPVRHVRFGKNANFEISAPGFTREAVDITVLSE